MTDKGLPTSSVYRQQDSHTRQVARTTIVLGILLLMCLAAAWGMSYSRSGRYEMQERASQLIAEVAQKRLTNYFKGESAARLYLVESERGPVGFSVQFREPLWDQGDQVHYLIREFFVQLDIARHIESESLIQDDLQLWTSIQKSIEGNIQLTEKLVYKDGVLLADSNYSPPVPLTEQMPFMNLVPPPLFDLFIRITQENKKSDGAEFGLPAMEPAGYRRGRVVIRPFEIIAGGDVPPALLAGSGDPRAMTIRWVDNKGGQHREQICVIDNTYQTTWSRELYLSALIVRQVTRQELADSLPLGAQMVQQWLTQRGIDSETFWTSADQ